VTGVKIITENEIVLKKLTKYCLFFTNRGEKFSITVNDANCHLSSYTSMHASIWHRYGDMAPQR